jgi:hypothetical protein
MLNDSVYINNFHFQNEAISKGIMQGVAGFDTRLSTQLANGAAGATERRCYVWHKGALGMATAQPFRVTVDWIPIRQGFLLVGSMLVGFKIIEEASVQFFDITN